MSTNRHLKVVPGVSVTGASGSSSGLRRDVALALVVVATLLIGVAGGALAPQSGAELQIPAAQPHQESMPAAQPDQEFVYFPSQFVNQGTEVAEHIPTF